MTFNADTFYSGRSHLISHTQNTNINVDKIVKTPWLPIQCLLLLFSLFQDFFLLSIDLQRLAADEVTPSAHFGGDALLLGQLLAHTLGEEHSSL
jgi:hypothetical protein